MNMQTQQNLTPYQHAIVIGGSIAGLLAARILTEHFARVTIIERDSLPETPEFRKGAPQARHAHGLLARGQQVMEQLFPGFTRDLVAAGAIPTNMGSEMAFYVAGQWVPAFQSALEGIAGSRALIENTLYRRLRTHEQITFLQEHDVIDLCTDAAQRQVTGVRVRDRRQEVLPEYMLPADLVVDASGRGSRTPEWLANLGYTAPTTTTVDAKAGYATRIYRRPANAAGWKVMYCIPKAPLQSRGGIIIPMEGDCWQVTLTGLNGDHPPTDEAGFLAFARSLPAPEFYAAIQSAEPVTAPYGYRRAENRLYHYDKLPRYLEGLLPVGDAVYAFNPVYGQGMTVAALGSLTLDACLRQQRQQAPAGDLTGLAQRFQGELAKVIAGPWQMATGQDLLWPAAGAAHKPDLVTRLIQRYLDRVLTTMGNNAEVAEAFLYVQNMLKPPTSLFHPKILWQVLKPQMAARPAPALPPHVVDSFAPAQ